ncbi:hypothetical protein D3C85_1516570 [compost metagenome]
MSLESRTWLASSACCLALLNDSPMFLRVRVESMAMRMVMMRTLLMISRIFFRNSL